MPGRIYFLATILTITTGLANLALAGNGKKKKSVMEFAPARAHDGAVAKGKAPEKKKAMEFAPVVVQDDAEAKRIFNKGINLYKRGLYHSASLLFFRLASSTRPEYESQKQKAEYFLARSLYKMKLYQASLIFFNRIIKKGAPHKYFSATLKWLAFLSHNLKGDLGLLKKIAAYEVRQFHPLFRDELLFLLGKHHYNQGHLEKAEKMFSMVSDNSIYYAKAKYLQGVVAVRADKARRAIKIFKDAAAIKSGKVTYLNNKELKEMGTLSLARVYYSVDRFQNALLYFRKIPRGSENWLRGLFEESWSHFRIKRYERSLGNLMTLHSPYFHAKYLPESQILKAVIYFRNCQFKQVKRIVNHFIKVYEPLEKRLTRYVQKRAGGLSEYFELFKRLNKIGRKEPLFKQVLDLVLTDAMINKLLKYITQLDGELKQIKKMPTFWKSAPLATFLYQEVTLQRSFTINATGKLAKTRFIRVRNEIRDLLNQAQRILFEVANLKTNQLQKELSLDRDLVKSYSKIIRTHKVDGKSLFWPFENEYWRDELGYYEYQIQSQCRRSGR